MSETEPHQPLIKADGNAFTEADLAEVIGRLADQGDDGRTSFRDDNAAAIAHDESPRILVATGPGTGKPICSSRELNPGRIGFLTNQSLSRHSCDGWLPTSTPS